MSKPWYLILFALALNTKWAIAFALPESKPIVQSINQAQVIVLAQITNYVPDPNDSLAQRRLRLNTIGGAEAHMMIFSAKSPGQYTFRVLQNLKGQSPPLLELPLPRIVSTYYDVAPQGPDALKIDEGTHVLLFLITDAKGQLTPVDFTLPLIPVSSDAVLKINPDLELSDQIMQLMLASLNDPILRRVNTYILHTVVGTQLMSAMALYVNDADLRTRGHVLYYMAINQQVIVIPWIAQLVDKTLLEGGTGVEIGVGKFTTPEAVPYLNPLLFHKGEYVRLNTMSALGKLADRSSVPYLLLALYDPEPQKVVAHNAFRKLSKFDTAIQFVEPRQFYADRATAIRPIFTWWQDELSGKHPSPTDADEPPPASPKSMPDLTHLTPQAAIALLNPLLFERSLTTRQQAMAALEKLADQSSIPYLLITLYDPDRTVAYQAYQTLHRLISDVGPAKPQVEFEAQKEAEVKALYEWWQDELVGLHTNDNAALIRLLRGDKSVAYKAYKKLHQLNLALGAIQSEDEFFAHNREELNAIEQWRITEWKKAHPQPPQTEGLETSSGAVLTNK